MGKKFMNDYNDVELTKAKPYNKTEGDAGPNIQKAEGPKGWHPDQAKMDWHPDKGR